MAGCPRAPGLAPMAPAAAGAAAPVLAPARVLQVALGEETSLRPPQPWLIRWEIFAVFAVSLGASALNAVLRLAAALIASRPLAGQQALLVGSLAANHWLDLVLQLAGIAETLAPVALVLYLMARSGEPPALIGLDASQPGRAGSVPDRLPPRPEPDRRARGAARRLVADPGAAAQRRAERPARRDPDDRLPAAPAGPARLVTSQGDRAQRLAARVLSPVPGLRRVHRQRGDGRDLRPALPQVGPSDAADRGAFADRRGRVRRLRRLARQGLLAALDVTSS